MVKNLKNILIFIFFLASCANPELGPPISEEGLRAIEQEDHQKCVAKGLNYGAKDAVVAELYWRCRYSVLMDRKMSGFFNSKVIRYNAAIDKMGEEILKNVSSAKYHVLEKIDDDVQLDDHEKCVSNGYDDSFEKNKDGYYRCRQNLVALRLSKIPQATNIYESAVLPEDTKETLKIVIDSRHTNKEATRVAELMQKYPNCIGLNVDSEEFKKCSDAAERSKVCIGTINSKQIKKELNDKIYCQEQAFIQFPDNYALAKDKSSSEIEKLEAEAKKIKDQETKDEINATLLYLEGTRSIDQNIGREVPNPRDGEEKAKEKLYNRVELLKLREHFIYRCNQKMEEKLPDFAQKLTEECMDIARDWDK